MYCTMCGKELPDGAVRCDECGTPVAGAHQQSHSSWSADGGSQGDQSERTQSSNGQSHSSQFGDNSYYQDNRSQYQYQYDYSNANGGEQPVYEHQSGARKGFAIASMVMGIVGLVGSCCSLVTFGVPSLLLGVMGLIFGILGLKSQGKGMAIAGIIMAALNLVIGVLLLIIMVASMSMTSNMTEEELEIMFEMMETMPYQMVRIKQFFLR